MACPGCDLLHRIDPLPDGGSAFCSRCGSTLKRNRQRSLDIPLALAITALLLFTVSHAFPLMSLTMHGSTQEVTIPGCVKILVVLGWPWLAAILITLVELAPLLYLGGIIHVLLRVRQGRANLWTARIFRHVQESQGWGMVEVFLLGAMVSYVKLSEMAIVATGPSLYALAGFIIASAALVSTLDSSRVWSAMEGKQL